MNIFFSFLSANYLLITAILLVFSIFLLIGFVFLFLQNIRNNKRLKIFFSGRKAQDLEEILAQQIKRQIRSEKEIKELYKSSRDLWKISLKSVQKVGVVRFNPFKSTGGDQSFAIALLDSTDSGVIISSLYTREGTRVYSKPMDKGKSKYPLSEEEKQAIERARK